jgi:hypothetical protein
MSVLDPTRTWTKDQDHFTRCKSGGRVSLIFLANVQWQSRPQGAPKTTRHCPICIVLRSKFARIFVAGWLGERTMPTQIRRPIRAIAFASVLLASGLAVSVRANTALAVDCLTAPNSSAPPNSHWYYRTDRTQQRKCWYIRADTEPSEQRAAQTAREAPIVRSSQSALAAVPYSRGARLSDQDFEKLYAEFLEWNRRAKN